MIEKHYTCRLVSDVVLPGSSNTEGNIKLLDFIPGSNFLGMVAAHYKDFEDESFTVFHSGSVKFSDAHLAINGKESYKTPLAFHELKLGDGIYNKLHLSDDVAISLRNEQKQLKQMRRGFINSHLEFASPEYSYTQKSAYDKEKRRSADGSMFGYSALKAGTQWHFSVCFEDEKHVAKVEEFLLGEKRLGKSKSAQYGKVTIISRENVESLETFTPAASLTYLYVNSRLALIDEVGNPQAEPTLQNLGLSSGEIVWEKSFIQTSSYTPYNYIRQTDEYTRVVINKGSVIALRNITETLANRLYVGAFLSEGFGEVLVNPHFLQDAQPKLTSVSHVAISIDDTNKDEDLIAFLEQKENDEREKFEVAEHVHQVHASFRGPNRAQWGEIRSFAKSAKNSEELLKQIKEYIEHGTAKKQWADIKERLYAEIKKSNSPIAFVKLLCMTASQESKKNENEVEEQK